jgi:hypothetical protein
MGTNTEYFRRTAYQPTYLIGDRVSVRQGPLLMIGTVGTDRLVNLERGPEVVVHLDLPIRNSEGLVQHLVVAPHNTVKPLREF